jgi:glycosyltransferase involved in cell wall biosynthesis
MPVYNEIETIREIVERVQAVPVEKEIIIVDDGSTDGTRDLLPELADAGNLRVVLHDRNQGKGAALRTGFGEVSGDVVLIQDADLEYDPKDYPALLEPIADGRADVVFGSRFIGGGSHRVLYYWHSVGNRFLTSVANALNDLNLSDMETCYKVFRADVLDWLTVKSNGFAFEPEFTAKIAKRRLRVYEVPISYNGRTYAEGKKIGWKDGLAALSAMIRFRLAD